MKDFNERRECTYINEYREYEDEMDFFSDVLVECNKRNLKANYLFGVITIKTNFSSWRFKPTNGKIRLMHKDNSSYHKGFHEQFRQYITIPDLIAYIDEHDKAKYTTQFIHFTLTYDGRRTAVSKAEC